MWGLWFKWRHRRWQMGLSAYLDGALSDSQQKRLKTHLMVCSVCQQDLAELQTTVQSVRDLPMEAAPRSFALSPEMVSAGAQPGPQRSPVTWAYQTSRLAAAFVMALAFVVAVDFLGGAGQEKALPTSAPASLRSAPESPADAPAAGAERAPATGQSDAARSQSAAAPTSPAAGTPAAAGLEQEPAEGGQPDAAEKKFVATPGPSPETPSAAMGQAKPVAPQVDTATGEGISPLRGLEIGLTAALVTLVIAAVILRRREQRM